MILQMLIVSNTGKISRWKNEKRKRIYISWATCSNSNFSNMLYDPSMAPLLKYINIYELNNGHYKKTTIKELDELNKE